MGIYSVTVLATRLTGGGWSCFALVGNTEAEVFPDMSKGVASDRGTGKGDATTTLLNLRTVLNRTSFPFRLDCYKLTCVSCSWCC